MANTTPVSPSELSKISKYVLAHEKILVIVLVAAAGFVFTVKILNYMDRRDIRLAAVEHEKLTTIVQTAAATDNSNKEAAAKYAILEAQLKLMQGQLDTAMATRDKQEKAQEVADRALPLPDLGKRWVALVNVPPAEIAVTSSGFNVNQHAAQETVVALEKVPQLQGDLKDMTSKYMNEATDLVALGDLNTGLHTQIDQLNKVVVQTNATCEADKNLIRADARKSKLHFLLAGIGIGYFLRMVTSHATGSVSPTAFGNVSVPLL